MTGEKLNNDNWKAKLEHADALQEYALKNKNAAWEILHDKLHKKQQPKFVWYRMAAACLVTVVASVSLLHDAANNKVAIDAAVKTQPRQNIVSQQPTQHPIIKKINTTHEVVKVKYINPTIDKQVKHVDDKNEIAPLNNVDLQHAELTDVKVVLPILKDSFAQTITIATAPKKMQIRHANELDDDGSNINMVQSHIPSRKKFLNQDIYTDYTLSVPASGFNILKRKNSPSN